MAIELLNHSHGEASRERVSCNA